MKVGFVAIVGRPNVGKSTLLNHILDYEVSITSQKPQTTRDKIRGIYNDEDSQIIFIDTPGIHKPQQILGESLNESSYSSLKDVDLILFLSPLNEPIGPGDKLIIEKIKNKKKIAIMTKIDTSDIQQAEKKSQKLKELGFDIILGTSVKIKRSIFEIIKFLKSILPEGKPFYDIDEITDKSVRFITKEIIREATINKLREEIPHSIGVLVEEFIEPKNEKDKYVIRAIIYVERESQKGIIVGKHGSMIKQIGIDSRQKLYNILGRNIFLELRVKVKKNWTNIGSEIKKMGY